MRSLSFRAFVLSALPLALLADAVIGQAQAPADDVRDTRHQLAEAQAEGEAARVRAEALETQAANATAAADRTAQQAAAIAARVQQAEADIAADEARIVLIEQDRTSLRANLAERQRPLIRLTAALQLFSRRPLAVALLRPGSLSDAVHLRALLVTLMPEVQRRTAALRIEITRGRALQAQARTAQQTLRGEEQTLLGRRQMLAAIETRQRLAARDVASNADREAERALALSEQARDLGSLVTVLAKADALGSTLALLPGPVIRPDRPSAGAGAIAALAEAGPQDGASNAPTAAPGGLAGYTLPVAGRLVSGFGNGASGIVIAARAGAQVVAPAAGRVAFAGPYRGYGQIAIMTHDGGWTSLLTGLARLDVQVGDALVAGAPVGIAGPGHPQLSVELRRDGQPVNPLDEVGR